MPYKKLPYKLAYKSTYQRSTKRVPRKTYRSYPAYQKDILSNNGRDGYFKLRGLYNITSDGAGNIISGFRLTQPDNYDGAATALTDWTGVAALYDQFRVTSIAVKWIPGIPNAEPASAVFRPLYVYADFDSTGLSPTDAAAIGYGNMQVKNMVMPWTYYIVVPPLTNTAASSVSMDGYMDTAAPMATGSLYLSKAGGLSNSTTYGTVVLTYYVHARVRK